MYMYKVDNKSKRYHIFDLEKWDYINNSLSFDELIEYLSNYQIEQSYLKYSNRILDNFNATLKDMTSDYIFYSGQEFVRTKAHKRRFVVLDDYHRIIDIREYAPEIIKRYNINNSKVFYSNFRRYRMVKYVGEGYKGAKFREEPVPFVNNKRTSYHRKIKVNNEKRQSADKEIQQYIRSKRKTKNLPAVKYKHIDNCWKTQSKKRKQWME